MLRKTRLHRLLITIAVLSLGTSQLTAQRPGRRGGRGGRGAMINQRLERAGLKLGGPIPDVPAFHADGKAIRLPDLLGESYTVIVSGCLTCPVFLRTFPGVEAVHRDYSPKGVKFYYLYKSLAHPENNGYVQPFTLEERLTHIVHAKEKTGAKIPWIADTIENDVKHALGDAPNSEFMFDAEGKIVYMQGWSNAAELRKTLVELVGPVERPTEIAELDINHDVVPRAILRENVLPPLEVPRGLTAVKIVPQLGKEPFYVKLRAEVTRDVFRSGEGKMYLGFHLDPIYSVYWNNLVAPLRFELTLPDGTQVTPAKGQAPKVEQEKDNDPREFLVDVTGASPDVPLNLKVDYFGCTNIWCRPISQSYTIHFEHDRDAGTAVSARGRGGGPGGFGPGRGGPGGGPGAFLSRLMEMDADGDGKLSPEELPERMHRRGGPRAPGDSTQL